MSPLSGMGLCQKVYIGVLRKGMAFARKCEENKEYSKCNNNNQNYLCIFAVAFQAIHSNVPIPIYCLWP